MPGALATLKALTNIGKKGKGKKKKNSDTTLKQNGVSYWRRFFVYASGVDTRGLIFLRMSSGMGADWRFCISKNTSTAV
jgi:hypothetical protein